MSLFTDIIRYGVYAVIIGAFGVVAYMMYKNLKVDLGSLLGLPGSIDLGRRGGKLQKKDKTTEELLEMIDRKVLAPEKEFLEYLIDCADNVLGKYEDVKFHPVNLQMMKMRTEILYRLSRRPMK